MKKINLILYPIKRYGRKHGGENFDRLGKLEFLIYVMNDNYLKRVGVW